MQGLHPQQQQLAALLSVALPKDDSSPPSEQDESSRLTALNSLHRAILYPHNALLVAHSSSFLSQGFSQLLADQSYAVRRSTAVAYGSLCSVVCSSVLASSGRQNHTVAGPVVDRFISWALPVLRDVSVGNGSAELALEALREFLDNGDPNGIEPYVLPVIKACQELLEDERTSLNLLHQLLGLLSLISLKFFRSFQPHFLDIIDLLIGWALVPDLPESDRCIIMDTFLQFQKHWLSNLQFSLDLLSKFLGDMEVLLNDTSIGTPQQFRRLLALLSCFLTVLQVTASGLLEMNMLEQMTGMLIKTVPQLLSCLSLVGKKFGWSKWVRESWRCLTLLAEILGEKFSTFYPVAFDILFQSLKEKQLNSSSTHVHGVLKSNLQLLSLQKLGLLPSSVQKMLRLCSPLSRLRLHPNYHVAGALAATYVFLLQHKNNEVIEQAMNSVMEELETLKNLLGNVSEDIDLNLDNLTITDSGCDSKLGVTNVFSEAELVALIKFDLSILLSCLCLDGNVQTVEVADMTTSYSERAVKVASYIFEKLSPFEHPIESCVNLQVHVMRTLKKLCEVEHSRKWTLTENSAEVEALGDSGKVQRKINLIIYYLRKYSGYITKGLHASSPLTVKLLALEWVQDLGKVILSWKETLNLASSFEESECDNISSSLLFSVLDAASDAELKVRSLVASILDILLQAGLIYPGHFFAVTEVVLERLGDSETSIRNAFVRVFSIVLPATLYICGNFVDEVADCVIRIGDRPRPHWKHVFALKQLPRQLCAQQLVSILSYISQRWKVPLSSWIQRLVFSCPGTKDLVSSPIEETGNLSANGLLLDVKVDGKMLDNICSTNNIAAAWWAIHEAARYCITVRLRTNLGGPTQTFAALERMLLDVAHVLKVEAELNEGNLNIGSSSAHLLPMRLLLDFVEALKKNVYNAYDGSFVLPSVTRQSSLFFRANKKVCEEWFHRICEPMMNAGLALQCHTATIHYCSLRLQDLRHIVGSALKEKSRMQLSDNLHNLRKRLAGDVLRVLRHAAMALLRNHEPEALAGLQKWVTITFSSLFEETYILLPHGGRVGSLSWITGLIYQAQGQYEKAGAHFLHLLQSEEALSCMDSDTVQFIISRIIESYTALSDWKSMETWLIELQALRAKHAGKSFSGALTTAGNEMNAIHALARFDEGDVQSAWSYLDLTPKSCNELTLDPRLALQRSEQMLLQAILLWRDGKLEKVLEETDKAKLMLQEALSVISLDGFSESAAYATQLHCIYIFEESCKIKSQDEQKKLLSMLSVLHQVVQIQINERSQDCNLWMKVFRIYKTILPTSQIALQLCQKLTTLARKQKNFSMAHRLIDYYRDNLLVCYEGRDRDLLANNLQHESILLLYAEEKHEDAMTNLWSFVGQSIVYPQAVECDRENMLKAKACLKLAKWFKQEYPSKKLESVLLKVYSDFSKFVRRNATSFSSGSIYSGELIPDLNPKAIFDEIVGMAAKCSSLVCPTLCKSWLSYASWCYTEAKGSLSSQDTVLRACSLSPVLEPEVSPNRFQLTEEEVSKVETIILKLFQRSGTVTSEGHMIQSEATQNLTQETSLRSLVQQVVYLVQIAAGSPGAESSDGKPPSTKLTSQLNMLLHTLAVGMEKDIITSSVNELIEIWWSLRQRRVALFGHAANGYLRFLSLSSSNPKEGDQRGPYHDILKQKTGNCILRATLYVLHILLNYGVELKDALESGLVSVPLVPWQEVTPQLFARLSSHSEVVVRKQLEGLLVMLAKLSPWSIVYPTLVGVNAYESEPPEELQRIIGCLTKRYPKLVQDVQLLINELGAVTVLWEEQWLSTLQDLHSDVLRRIAMLKEEAARMAENTTLSRNEKNKINAAKYSAMMAPIIVALERRLVTTSRKPETAHEIWFQKDYGEQLKSAIAAFKIPPASLESLGEVWRPFDVIAASLANHQRKSSVALSEIAPRLALLSSSDVPVPGLETQISISDSSGGAHVDLQGFITISSFCDQVSILSTKTKPKKLVIIGSNGQKYTYLLKGREDLRLDARIMQLLQAINSCLYSFHGTHSNSVSIRNYSVTPISGRAGLIQWVDNVTSIYSIFKAWQSRAQQVQLSAMGASIARNSPMPPVPRPSDMFYGKIIPALKEKGIRKVISRGDWPHDVKRKVLLELMNETPKQLLHQEIWCASEGFRAFNSKLKRFSGSVAAMSMVGHVLGLGDRHLDNILMDFCTGDVVHIDYNVCFDKGKRLKIPEIVPFRLTQTIEAALGLTGIEGTFRANCEAVVEVLRKNKDILLMLLDVFVWDPLVEWTRDDSHDEAAIGGEERKGMELAVSLSLFASRIQEIRFPLQEHHDLLLATLPATESALEKFLIVLDQYEVVSALFFRADQDRSNLLLHETSAKSIVAEATSNSEKTRTAFEVQAREFTQAKAVAIEMAQESTLWMEQHGRVIDALRNGSVPDVQPFVALGSSGEALSLTSAVVVAGVPLTIVPEPTLVQCQDIDKEVSQFIAELVSGLSCVITALQEYAVALQRVLPLNYITTSPVHGWVQALQLTVHNLSSETLTLGKRQAAELLTKFQGGLLDSIRKRHEDLSIQMERQLQKIEEVEEECSELLKSIGSETEAKSKDRLISAFSKFMQSSGYSRKEEDGSKDLKVHGELEEKKLKVITILHTAACAFYNNVKGKILDNISSDSNGKIISKPGDDGSYPYSGITYGELEEQIEKCSLLASFVNEIQQLIGVDLSKLGIDLDQKKHPLGGNWASVFQASVLSCRLLIGQITEVALPEIIRSVVSYNSEVMDAFGSLSQIRGSIDTTLEQLIEVDLERLSIRELEQNYFVKVGFITEQQLALEEAALKGRDHLSWEEAEELATQEEACRAQLDQLHRTWNQKDAHTSSLAKREASLQNALISAERHFSSLTNLEQSGDVHPLRSKGILATLAKPFSELESVDQLLASFCSDASYGSGCSVIVSDLVTSGCSISESIWKYPSLLSNHSFFIWKVGLVDTILDSCIHDISSSMEHNLGFEQLYNVLKKKIVILLQEHVVQYLKERVAPVFLARLEMENEHLKFFIEATQDLVSEQVKKDVGAARKVQNMLEEYCVAHETARAAKSAVSLMKRQVAELTEALQKACLEIVQLEWVHNNVLPYSQKNKAILLKYLGKENWAPTILNLERNKLLENIQSSMSSVARSLEYLQACERTSVTAEGQLERAMGWACGGPSIGGPSSTSAKNTGIPPQFHDHLVRRRQLLWAAREQSLDIMKICSLVLEFEASRDGKLWMHGEKSSAGATDDGRFWQQAYLNALTRLDATYHSFARAEQEWKLAQSSMEAAASGLLTATNELCIASAKAKSASGDMQSTLAAIQESAYEASLALSAFVRVTKEHTALTSECGPMLEEVLAITEGLHDVHNLGKEAAAVHRALMDDLSEASMILQPLEATMSTDVAALSEAITRERESKMEISPIHGQALYQSYSGMLNDACNSLRHLVPSVAHAVKELHAMLTKLARTASVHAGNLHKALEGLGESQVVRSQEVVLPRSELESDSALFGNENEIFRSHETEFHEFPGVDESTARDEEWISPPDNSYESSQESTITSRDSCVSTESLHYSQQAMVHNIRHCAEKSPSIPPSGSSIPEISYAEKSLSQLDERDSKATVSSTGSSIREHLQTLTSSTELTRMPQETIKQANSLGESEVSTSNQIKKSLDNHEDTLARDIATPVNRGKNAYALQVLRRIEMKIDGRDTSDGRQMDISEQVDHLLKQATNVDNLCNMYEGWTPWI